MTETSFFRQPTQNELASYIDVPIHTGAGRVLTPKDRFNARIAQEVLKCTKKGIPFAEAVARADVKDIIDSFNKKWKRQGFVDSNYKFPEIDWNKYSDLKNFEVLDEGQVNDKYLSKIHRLPIFVKYKKYRFKGFSNTYNVMEPEEEAIERAVKKQEARNIIQVQKTPETEKVKKK